MAEDEKEPNPLSRKEIIRRGREILANLRKAFPKRRPVQPAKQDDTVDAAKTAASPRGDS